MASNYAKFVLKVSNIPWTVSRHELALYFSRFGYVHKASVAFDGQSGINQGYGHVTFVKKENVDSVLDQQHFLEGNSLIVSLQRPGEVNSNNNNNFN